MIQCISRGAPRTVLVDRVVNESQFADHRRRQYEWVAVGQPQASTEVIQYIGEREPRIDHGIEVLMAWIERVRRRLHARLTGTLRPQREAGGSGRLERIDHMQVVGP